MKPVDKHWPPLIIADSQPVWVRVRDTALTVLAWLTLVILLNRELELGVASFLRDWGFGTLVDRPDLGDPDQSLGWLGFLRLLVPYFTIVAFLLAFLFGFGLHTVLRRRNALKAPPPRPLSLEREARDAGLTHTASNTNDPIGVPGDEIVSGVDLLSMLNAQDRAALVAVRCLRIARVEVDSIGHFRVMDGTSATTARV